MQRHTKYYGWFGYAYPVSLMQGYNDRTARTRGCSTSFLGSV